MSFRQKREASREHAFCSCGVPACCAKASGKLASKSAAATDSLIITKLSAEENCAGNAPRPRRFLLAAERFDLPQLVARDKLQLKQCHPLQDGRVALAALRRAQDGFRK